MDCKEALSECNGDITESIDFLRKKGLATASKRAGRPMSEGVVESYIHMGNKLGVMVEINCETDFVAKNDDFREFAKNINVGVIAAGGISSMKDIEDLLTLQKDGVSGIITGRALYDGSIKLEEAIDIIDKGR